MAFQYAHHRPLTPITPVHSPHPSNASSIRTRTPGQLSLHEYRKQQVTPSPPALQGQRSVKKKRAASSLNRSERTPAESASPVLYPSFHTLSTPPLTPSLVAPANFSLHQLQPNASATRYSPVIPEFSHLSFAPPTHQHKQKTSLESEDAPLLDRFGSSSSSLSQLLPPSPPPHLAESTPHFLSSLFPFTHTTLEPAQGGYHALGGESVHEGKRSTSRLVKSDSNSPGSGRPSQLRSTDERTRVQAASGPSNDFHSDLSDQKNSVGSRAPWYVLSARLPEIGVAVGGFEDEQAIGLLQNDSDASSPGPKSNLFRPQDLAGTKFEEGSQFLKQQVNIDAQPRERERHFKATKRLPHPESELNTKKRPLPLKFPAYSGKPLAPPASIQTSSTSTLSLSNFNFPQPPTESRSSARGKHVTFGLQEDLPSRTSTPTVIQHRGISFELINPHDSLRLSDIRTPLEVEDPDFFSGPITPLLATSKMADHNQKSDKQKPHAQLFGTVTEALSVIRKRSGPFRDTPDRPQTPFDDNPGRKKEDPRGRWIPQNVNTDPYLGRDMTPEERKERVEYYQQQMAEANRPSTPSMLMSKASSGISSVAGSIKRKSTSQDENQEGVSPTESVRGSSLFKAFRSKRESGLDGADDDYEDDQEHESEAGTTDNVLRTYEESNYAHSAYARSVVDNRYSVPFGVLVGQIDYSEISALDEHRFSSITQASAAAQMEANPSTISEILHGYEDSRSSEIQRVETQVESAVHARPRTDTNPFIGDSGSSEEVDVSHLGPWGNTPLLSRTDSEARRRGIKIHRPPSSTHSHMSSEQRAKAAWYEKNGTEEEKRVFAIEQEEWYAKHALWKAEHRPNSEATGSGRHSDDVLSREITGLSEDILTQLSPDRETTGQDEFTSSTISRPVQPPSAPPTYGLPPLPPNVNRPVGLFAGRDGTPSSSEFASHAQSYGDTHQLLDISSSAHVGRYHPSAGSYPTRIDRAPVTAQDFPLESEDSDEYLEPGKNSTLAATPAKKLRVMNPDPLSADSKGSVQRTPPSAERGNLLSETSSDFSGNLMSPLTRLNDMGKQRADETTGQTVEDFRNPFFDFDSVWNNTSDRRHGVPREHAFFNPEAVERPLASRSSDEEDSFHGSLADMSDDESLSNLEQTEDEIVAIMEEGGEDDWAPRNRDSQADEWTTVRDPSQSSMAESLSMAEYSVTPGVQVYQNPAFRSGATITPENTFSIPLSQAHVFGHSGHVQGSHSPHEWQNQGQHNISHTGYYVQPNGGHTEYGRQFSSPANSTGRQVQALQKYVFIPDEFLSPDPDDSPAQCDGHIDRSYVQLSQTSSPPQYLQQGIHVEPTPPDPVYYSPTRNVNRRSRHVMDLESQQGIEMGAIRGQRIYRQHNGSQVARASVHSQRTLQPLALQPTLLPSPHYAMGSTQQPAMGSDHSLTTDRTRWSWLMKCANRFSAGHSNVPITGSTAARARLPMTAVEVRRASTMSELQQSRLPGHSITADRRRALAERRAGIICLVSLGWFPPFAMLLGYGKLNEYVRLISYGDVERLPRWWRVTLRRVGWAHIMCWVIVLVVIIAYHSVHLI